MTGGRISKKRHRVQVFLGLHQAYPHLPPLEALSLRNTASFIIFLVPLQLGTGGFLGTCVLVSKSGEYSRVCLCVCFVHLSVCEGSLFTACMHWISCLLLPYLILFYLLE